MDKIPFTEKAVKEYLDKSIRFWRKRRKESYKESPFDAVTAEHYIDAYQSVRTSLFEETLPTGEEK